MGCTMPFQDREMRVCSLGPEQGSSVPKMRVVHAGTDNNRRALKRGYGYFGKLRYPGPLAGKLRHSCPSSGVKTTDIMAQSLPNLSASTLFDLSGKVIVVTGGGTGLGFMMATAFVQSNAKRVYICSRKRKNLEAAAASLNALRENVCHTLEADLTTADGCKALARQIAQREDSIDVLVNNSGVSWAAPLEETEEARGWDRVMNVNVKSIFYLTVALLPLLERDVSVDRPASVINISSIYATLPLPNMPSAKVGHGAWSYLASKAAVSQLTRTMAANLNARHINVNAIAPGFFPTNMTRTGDADHYDRSYPAGRQGTPQDMAGPALLLSSRAGAHLSGIVLGTDGGILAQNFKALPPDLAQYWLPQSWVKKQGDQAKL